MCDSMLAQKLFPVFVRYLDDSSQEVDSVTRQWQNRFHTAKER